MGMKERAVLYKKNLTFSWGINSEKNTIEQFRNYLEICWFQRSLPPQAGTRHRSTQKQCKVQFVIHGDEESSLEADERLNNVVLIIAFWSDFGNKSSKLLTQKLSETTLKWMMKLLTHFYRSFGFLRCWKEIHSCFFN